MVTEKDPGRGTPGFGPGRTLCGEGYVGKNHDRDTKSVGCLVPKPFVNNSVVSNGSDEDLLILG